MAIPVLQPIDMGANKITNTADPTSAQDVATKSYSDTWYRTAGIVIGNGQSTPVTGSKGYLRVPYSATILEWTLIGDQVGNAQITIKKCSFGSFPATSSIVASAPPNLGSQQINSSSTLTGWTTSINAGDVLEFNLDSVSACTRLTLQLRLQRT